MPQKKDISRRRYLKLLVQGGGLALALGAGGGLTSPEPAIVNGQAAPFGLPLAGAPGAESWFVRQWYGNTRWAYRQRRALYSQGQGMHFGVDFFSTCGTPVVAIGDGTILAIDGPYGSAPHNVLVKHANGLVSLYGHLLERSTLRIGQVVKQGEAIGKLGAPTGADCDTHPHVHLEIREASLGGTRNPVKLITTDWANLTLGATGEGLQFQVDLNQPSRWQTIFDQPDVRFGGPLLNDYERSWP